MCPTDPSLTAVAPQKRKGSLEGEAWHGRSLIKRAATSQDWLQPPSSDAVSQEEASRGSSQLAAHSTLRCSEAGDRLRVCAAHAAASSSCHHCARVTTEHVHRGEYARTPATPSIHATHASPLRPPSLQAALHRQPSPQQCARTSQHSGSVQRSAGVPVSEHRRTVAWLPMAAAKLAGRPGPVGRECACRYPASWRACRSHSDKWSACMQRAGRVQLSLERRRQACSSMAAAQLRPQLHASDHHLYCKPMCSRCWPPSACPIV